MSFASFMLSAAPPVPELNRSPDIKRHHSTAMSTQKYFLPLISLFIFALFPGQTQAQQADVIAILRGATIVAQDGNNTVLGTIDSEFKASSIFNTFGTYGSEFGAKSIFNQYGTFGGEYSLYSPFNKYTTTPPMIIKKGKLLGYLSANKYLTGAISVPVILSLKEDF
jgi:hypothetical protein